jgi:hypothetical protein
MFTKCKSLSDSGKITDNAEIGAECFTNSAHLTVAGFQSVAASFEVFKNKIQSVSDGLYFFLS